MGSRKGIWPVKKLSGGVLAWLSAYGKVLIAYGPLCGPFDPVNPDWFYLYISSPG